jgi:hypothetical protein
MNLPNYVLLLQMVFMAGPIVHGSFLWMYFILTTVGFIFLEWRQPRYHQDGWFLVRAIRTMSKSSFHLFKTILIQLGLMYVTSFTAQSNTFLSYGAVAVGLVGCMSSLNPLSIFSGVKQAGEDIFEITKERYTEAMQTKFNIEDLFVSRSLKNQLLPINFKEETSPIPLLQLSELLAITEIEPKNFIAIERARSKKRSLMSNKEKETVQKLLEGPRIEEVEEEEERPKLKLN